MIRNVSRAWSIFMPDSDFSGCSYPAISSALILEGGRDGVLTIPARQATSLTDPLPSLSPTVLAASTRLSSSLTSTLLNTVRRSCDVEPSCSVRVVELDAWVRAYTFNRVFWSMCRVKASPKAPELPWMIATDILRCSWGVAEGQIVVYRLLEGFRGPRYCRRQNPGRVLAFLIHLKRGTAYQSTLSSLGEVDHRPMMDGPYSCPCQKKSVTLYGVYSAPNTASGVPHPGLNIYLRRDYPLLQRFLNKTVAEQSIQSPTDRARSRL